MELVDRPTEAGVSVGGALSSKPAAEAEQRVRTYEELDGAEGRAVYFRPQRYTAEELLPLKAMVTVGHQGFVRECALHDVSQNGVAFVWPADATLRQGAVLKGAAVRFDGHEAYRGELRVNSLRPSGDVQIVGASFADFLIDIDEVLELRGVRAWDGGLRAGTQAWAVAGHDRFKSLVAELRLFLEEAQERLGKLEKELPWHVVHGKPSAARTALMNRVKAELAGDVVRYTEQIDVALREANNSGKESQDALRAWSVRQMDPLFMQAPWMHRARTKPFGYAGDYEVMNFVYERTFEGSTLFAKALGLSMLQAKPSLAVRFRKDLMKRQLKAAIDERAGRKEPVRVLSIAAGPAQELVELLSEIDDLPASLEIVLFDQDKGALAHAYRRLKPILASRFEGRARMVILNESIKRLLRDAHLFDQFGKFDVVYSCGLFDYLQPTTAMRLARNLHGAAAPGGKVFIANMVDHHGRWFMEHHLEWDLLYRTRDELREIGQRAAPRAAIRVLEEETGVNPFIELTKES